MSALSTLDPQFRPYAEYFITWLRAQGVGVTITSTRRSRATQQRLYNEWLAGRNPYPVARPGTSRHEHGHAFDMVVTPRELAPAVGRAWEDWAPGVFRWGGSRDPVHFEVIL